MALKNTQRLCSSAGLTTVCERPRQWRSFAALFCSGAAGFTVGALCHAKYSSSCSSGEPLTWKNLLPYMLTFGGSGGESQQVAWCRPLETPEYLIPYYLRDVRSRFEHYASVKRRVKGKRRKYMTAEDFVCALLATKETELSNKESVSDLQAIFSSLDANKDGLLSFTEFSFLMLFLTHKPRNVELLVTLMDADKKGSVTLPQFCDVLLGLGDDMHIVHQISRGRYNGIVRSLFGDDGSGRCTYADLHARLHAVMTAVWTAEFKQYDTEHTGFVSSENFGEMMASSILGTHIPFHIVNNIKRLRGDDQAVSLSSWLSFHRIMTRGDEIQEVVEMFCHSGAPLRKQDFNRAVVACGLPELQKPELDIIFSVFDCDGNGTVDINEFFSVMKQKMNLHVRPRPREVMNLPTRTVHCAQEAWKLLQSDRM